ncbi:type II toxin-antitoxin system RelE/ParE family toxin [Sphingobium ummariense]
MLPLLWRPEARQDMRDITDYIAQRRPDAAIRLRDAILHTADNLPNHPYMHRPGRKPGAREAIIHPNYILIYRVAAEAIEVLALVHARQQYP